MEVGAVSGGADMPTIQQSSQTSSTTSITSTSGGSEIDNAAGLALAMKILEMLAGQKEDEEGGGALNALMMMSAMNQGGESNVTMISSHSSVTSTYESAPTEAGENLNVEA